MKDLSQEQIERTTNRARKILEDKGLEFFIVAGNKNGGASHTKSFSKGSAAAYARKAHTRWEKKHGIDPEHGRDKMYGINKIAATRLDKVFKAASDSKKRDLLVQLALGTKTPSFIHLRSDNKVSLLREVSKKNKTYDQAYKEIKKSQKIIATPKPTKQERISRVRDNSISKEFSKRRDDMGRGGKYNGLGDDFDPNAYYGINHHGGINTIKRSLAGGKPKESMITSTNTPTIPSYGIEVTIKKNGTPKSFNKDMTLFADKARDILDTPGVLTGRIKGKYLRYHQGSNGADATPAYLSEEFMKHIKDLKIERSIF